MKHLVGFLILAIVALAMLDSAGPTLVGLANAATPLVLGIGAVFVVTRVAWHFTNRD